MEIEWVPKWLKERRDTSLLLLEGEDSTCMETDFASPHFSESPQLNPSVICGTFLSPKLVRDT